MLVGVLSDTHGQVRRTHAAIRLLRRLGARAFIHCGDVCGQGVLDAFVGLRAWLVCGNCDDDSPAISRYAESLNLVFALEKPLTVELEGRTLLVFHGHEAAFARLVWAAEDAPAAAAPPVGDGRPTYVLHGHTHVARDVRRGAYRVVNPGALHRAGVFSVATIDLASDEVKFWQVHDCAGDSAPPVPYDVS
jgi:hypothetical protein